MQNPVTRYCTFAGMFRLFAMFSCDYYIPAFFLSNYPGFSTQFSICAAAITLCGGMFSSMVGGFLSDKYGKKNNLAYSRIAQIGALIAWPFFTMSVLTTNNFWISVLGTLGKYVFGENWWSPNMTMIQKTVPSNKYGKTVSAYQFYTIMAGCSATVIFGYLVNLLGGVGNGPLIGKILAGCCSVGYVGSIISW